MSNTALIALAGNPNVGKSTLFNALTGLHQHTGNWPGKTVVNSHGSFFCHQKRFQLIDLPGIYSLSAPTAEEAVTADFIRNQQPDLIVVVLDASCLERNLPLAMQIITTAPNVIVCVNLLDEAASRNITPDLTALSKQLGTVVIGTSADNSQSMSDLKEAIFKAVYQKAPGSAPAQALASLPAADSTPTQLYQRAEQIVSSVIHSPSAAASYTHWLDDIFTSRLWGFPLMLLLLMLIFFLTLHLANYPSQLLSELFTYMQTPLSLGLLMYGIPVPIHDMLIYGIYRTLSWVIAVMLPPMAIFFPLFTLLEDFGYLPRVAFNLDQLFKKCHTCGKQSLTSCMALGCNAAGVIACRIIDSPRERLIAIVTNNFIPCNGRMPLYLTLSSIFICAQLPSAYSSLLPAVCITLLIACGIIATLGSAWLLSHTLLQGTPSTNIIELPPYRRPRFTAVLYHSLIERTLFVLKRAVIVAAPAGLIIWLLANISLGSSTLLSKSALLLNPLAELIGIDGYILLAFILALPANEIFLPLLLMAYLNAGQLLDFSSLNSLHEILIKHHWTVLTAINVMLFSLFHWPCSTTLLTIYRETSSVKWTVLSCILPTSWGIMLCLLTTFIFRHC